MNRDLPRPAQAVQGPPRVVTCGQLTVGRRRLVRLAQWLYFGTILDLRIRRGEPVLDPPPRATRRKKPRGCNTPRPQADSADFALKQDWVDFFADLDAIGDGTILSIEIAHGLPLVYEFDDVFPG